ncbi:MAG: sensor histidine kinase [Candidatus Promineifilaceae bacterium]
MMWRGERRTRILIVDDESGFRETLARRLEKRGAVVNQATGGKEALASLAQESVDVVLLDVRMPGMDGLAVLEHIRQEHPDTEVILITGNVNTQEGVAGIKAGAFDYLTKPIEIEHLVGKIRQAFDKLVRTQEQAREARFRVRMEQQLIAADRLAALGTLSAGTAHEINNPLAIINDAAGWLKSRAAKDESISDAMRKDLDLALDKIESSVKRARRITHQLLSFSRQADSMTKEFNLSELAVEVVELTRKIASELQAEVNAACEVKDMRLWSDPYQVRQVLINLVTNGLQAAAKGGTVELIITGNETDAIAVVRDNGPGIPPENLERIFEPFFTTKPPGEGTGLGLSVSRGIVEKLGGRIEVESKLGAGAVFKVILHRKPTQAADKQIEDNSR